MVRYGRRSRGNGALFVILLVVLAIARIMDRSDKPARAPSSPAPVPVPVSNPIGEALRPAKTVERREGVVAAILIDTSGSMQETVKDVDGSRRPKIQIAQRAATDLVNEFAAYAREHHDEPVFLGIYEFSDRGRSQVRPVVKLGPAAEADPQVVRAAVSNMRADGGTPIGDAMIAAKLDIDATGLSKRHILVITDGENNKGYSPADVTRSMTSQAEQDRASIYFVAFDIGEETFKPVRDAGGLVLAASNETELKGTLDYLLTGKILVEQPERR
jgi:hypothetical protein